MYPRGIFIKDESQIHIVYASKQSLYELIHHGKPDLDMYSKLMILAQIAKILNSLHGIRDATNTPMAHGSLSSHNIFIKLPDTKESLGHSPNLKVQIDGIELRGLKSYANKFFSYRAASVWSAPEVLAQPKKLAEPDIKFDVFSFGVLMWEVFFESVPFDGSVSQCTDYVVRDKSRPIIYTATEDDEEDQEQLTVT